MKGYFLIILIFVLAFGIALQAILLPGDKFKAKVFIDVFNIAYWQIFGDTGVLEKIKCENEENCTISQISSFILLMIYMVIANVLLINLLIAMFRLAFKSKMNTTKFHSFLSSNTYENIQERSDIVWKNQRYGLIVEYYYLVPSPLNLLAYIYNIINYIIKKNFKKQPIFTNFDGECEYLQK